MQPGDHWVVLTGAGISADSGLETFRGGGGLWEGHRIEEVATPEAWERQPEVVWRFYQERRRALLGVEPNAGHRALARLEAHASARGIGFTLISQNVDDLHERAGSTVLAMHGQLLRLRCEPCGATVEDREHFDPRAWVACPDCGAARLRPDIVWFGEIPYHLDAIEQALGKVTHFLACGTSGAVYPAAGLLAAARGQGAQTWVNALERPANLDERDTFLEGRASEVLPAWVDHWIEHGFAAAADSPWIYKIVPAAVWNEAQARGSFGGAGIDLADGYIHFSTGAQAAETAAKHLAGVQDLLLVAVSVERLERMLASALRWEPSRGGALFPHLYAPMPLAAVDWVAPLPWDPSGEHRFPERFRS
ncbi:MAG TPA: DUF952 domain-containing protein [Planctomycetota bacterium]|nr:DUF952 domain-containing protein [Planctomycetota bacterium]